MLPSLIVINELKYVLLKMYKDYNRLGIYGLS